MASDFHGRFRIRSHGVGHVCLDEAGRDGIDGDVRDPISAPEPCEPDDPAFDARVIHLAGIAHQANHDEDIDDAAPRERTIFL